MTKITLIGDIHGDIYNWSKLIEGAEQSVQLGDFGIGFFEKQDHKLVADFFDKNLQHRFIRGNHDNPALCKSMRTGYIQDGHIEIYVHTPDLGDETLNAMVPKYPQVTVMYIGGAASYDKQYRLANGLPWWEEEELTPSEQLEIYSSYVKAKPDIVIAHDAPQTAIQKLMFDEGPYWSEPYYPSLTNKYLDSLWRAHQPYMWFFGHWHTDTSGMVGNTEFFCLNSKQTFVLDTMRIARELKAMRSANVL